MIASGVVVLVTVAGSLLGAVGPARAADAERVQAVSTGIGEATADARCPGSDRPDVVDHAVEATGVDADVWSSGQDRDAHGWHGTARGEGEVTVTVVAWCGPPGSAE